MNRKIIFLDCDGTLFDVPRGMPKASEKTKYAISELIKNGHLVFIASGRCMCIMSEDIKTLKPTGFITANGACVIVDNRIIFKKDILDETKKRVIDYCNSNDGVFYLESQDYIYTKDKDSSLHKKFVETWGISFDAFDYSKSIDDSYQLVMTAFDNKESFIKFEKTLKPYMVIREQYGFTSFDVSDFGINKGLGVKKLLEYYNINKEDAYAFGDGLNDIEMFEEVSNSYAVNNAKEELKAVAKYIAPDVLEDGFYQIMIKDKLIKPINN